MTSSALSQTTAVQQSWEQKVPAAGGLVVAVDGSAESLAAFNTAASIARARRCPLHVVSVIPPLPVHQLDPGNDKGRANVEELRIQLREASIRDVFHVAGADHEGWTYQVLVGQPAKMITQVAKQRGAELILAGRRLHGVMDRIMGGETTLQIMRLSPIPVIAVPADFDGPQSIVVATDFFAPSRRAATIAADLLGKSGRLYVVYVEPPVEVLPRGFTIPDGQLSSDATQRLRELIDSLRLPPGVVAEPVVLNGKPVSAVVEFSERVGANMIAAGSHGHTRMERFLLGSVSTGLVRNAACPVLVAPDGD